MKMASFCGACLNQALLVCVLAPGLALEVSRLQHGSRRSRGPSTQEAEYAAPQFVQQAPSSAGDLAMVHVPYNFGHTVAAAALAQSQGAVHWSLTTKELRSISEVGCPLYFTPQKYWPKDVAESYFDNKKIFGILRDPYERLVAQFRGGVPGYGAYGASYRESCDVNGAIKEQLTKILNNSTLLFDEGCTFLPQVEYFQGEYGIQLPIDNRYFPSSMNEVLAAHNYSVHISQEEIIHVSGCDDIWAADLNAEVRHLVQTVYKDDFDLICKSFGYCDVDESVCLVEVPEMCPPKAFDWDMTQMRYVPKASS